jgi:hypothetical protein
VSPWPLTPPGLRSDYPAPREQPETKSERLPQLHYSSDSRLYEIWPDRPCTARQFKHPMYEGVPPHRHRRGRRRRLGGPLLPLHGVEAPPRSSQTIPKKQHRATVTQPCVHPLAHARADGIQRLLRVPPAPPTAEEIRMHVRVDLGPMPDKGLLRRRSDLLRRRTGGTERPRQRARHPRREV